MQRSADRPRLDQRSTLPQRRPDVGLDESFDARCQLQLRRRLYLGVYAAHGAGHLDELVARRARGQRRTGEAAGPHLVPADLEGLVSGHGRMIAPWDSWRYSDRADAGELFDRGQSREDLLDAVGPERVHRALHGRALELLVARLSRRERRELLVHRQELEDADPAAIPGLPAADAAVAAEQLALSVAELLGHARRLELLLARVVELLAVLAEPPREALGEHAGDCGSRQERLHTHLVEAGERARRVVRVQGREDEVAGERRFDRDLRGLHVADLADHHDVGIRAEDRPQRRGERQSGALVDLHLVEAG